MSDQDHSARLPVSLPVSLPEQGVGETEAAETVGTLARTRAALLGHPDALAHMDPPPPGIAADLVGLNARLNQNLLHPDLSPFATQAEQRVIAWLLPFFGMRAGHMCAGSTIANLTALWCAREHGARRVIASSDAHVSIPKSAHILGLPFQAVPTDPAGRLDRDHLGPTDDAAVVLTAGTTGRGVIDDLAPLDAAWVHVDAAWAGPLRLTRFADRLDGIDRAQSVAISAHKWLFQPKDSALVMFADPHMQEAISFGADYLVTPNVGVQGSRGAAGVALLGTLLAWGRGGMAQRIEHCVDLADALAAHLETDPRIALKQPPDTAVLTWRAHDLDTGRLRAALGHTASGTLIDGAPWIRQVAANPHADLNQILDRIDDALRQVR